MSDLISNIIEEKINVQVKTIEKAVRTLKNRKTPGPGGINAELIKNKTSKLFRKITRMFNRCINGQTTPKNGK